MKRKLAIAAIIVVLMTVNYYMFFREDDKRAVVYRLESIIANIEKPKKEGNLGMLAKHQALSGMVADHLHAECKKPDITVDGTADVVLSQYAQARQFAQTITLSYTNPKVTFPEKGKACLNCYGTAVIKTKGGQLIEESRPVVLTFIKKDKKWLLADAREKTVFK